MPREYIYSANDAGAAADEQQLAPDTSLPVTAGTTPEFDVFEGPEKKLEIFFRLTGATDGFRRYTKPVWSDVLADAKCSILHSRHNDDFDAYLLSESSMFVYPHKLILKTCGTTTLLLVLPKVLALAEQMGGALDHVHYSHFRYAFPQLQPYPHSSFGEEQRTLAQLLKGRVGEVSARSIGNAADSTAGCCCWYALYAEAPAEGPSPDSPSAAAEAAEVATAAKAAAEAAGDEIFEVAMEGLSASACDLFFGSTAVHEGKTSKALAISMREHTGIGALVAGATIDDWAFEPCGYSMNALRGPYYYTVHVTPEIAFSYASFETNDPSYATAEKIREVASAFDPTSLTVTLTTRGVPAKGGEMASLPELCVLAGATATSHEACQLSPNVSIRCCSFERAHTKTGDASAAEKAWGEGSVWAAAKKVRDQAAAEKAWEEGSVCSGDAGSWADSESTAPLEETRSDDGDEVAEVTEVTKRAKTSDVGVARKTKMAAADVSVAGNKAVVGR